MRRKDREVTDAGKIRAVIQACHCCRLGFYDSDEVYIVPLNFGYEECGESRTFYFHGAAEGRQIELIKAGGPVGFELDTGYELHAAKEACGYSARFQSVIGTGSVSLIEDPAEKLHALGRIMYHNTGREDWEFPLPALEKMSVFKLEVDKLFCKEHE